MRVEISFFSLFSDSSFIQVVASVASIPALFVSVVLAVVSVLQLYGFVTGAAFVACGLGLVEAAAVEQLVQESQSSEREYSEDENEEDYKAGNIPAIMEREDLLHWSSTATGHGHGDLEGGKRQA